MEWLRQRFELSRGGSGHNVRPMEGMRGFAVFLVFLVHYVTLIEPWISGNAGLTMLAGALHTIGNAGVDLFFVLSGYLIYGSLIERPTPFPRYLKRRVTRIYPAFIAVYLVYLGLSFAFPAESKLPASPPEAALYLLENFLLLPGLFPIEPMITVAWSLSYEMFYYLAIPLLIAVFRLRSKSRLWRSMFFLTTAVLTAAYCARYGGHARLIMFISGILLHEALNATRTPAPPGIVGLVALACGLLATLLPVTGNGGIALKSVILFVTFTLFCLTCFRNPAGWLAKSFCWTPMRWLGNMSYSYYLLHGLTLKAAFMVLPRILPATGQESWLFWMLLPVMFTVTLLPTATLFLTIERPLSLAPGKPATR